MTHEEDEQLAKTIISIHMPHTWHDAAAVKVIELLSSISIHMPHTWHDGTDLLYPCR